MKFEYEVTDGQAVLKRCYGEEERVEVPESLDGCQVREIAPYCFSQARREPDQGSAICGEQVKEIRLPRGIRKIGAYAFYGCYHLERLTLYHETEDIAGGAFTGCHHLRELVFYMDHASGYCMKDILSELHHELRVHLLYGTEDCTLLFPEYYEEAVENTPARILETHFHGAGYSYRQCFRDGVLQFGEYDHFFLEGQHLEREEFCTELCLLRLKQPRGLSETAGGIYQSWLMEHRMAAAYWCLDLEQEEALEYLMGLIVWRQEELKELIEEANRKGRLAMQSLLMEEMHHRFGKKKKTFEL